jgi:hypothetical protein
VWKEFSRIHVFAISVKMSIQDKVLMRKIKKREKQKLKLVQQKESQKKEKLVQEEEDLNDGLAFTPSKGVKRVQNEELGPAKSEYFIFYVWLTCFIV